MYYLVFWKNETCWWADLPITSHYVERSHISTPMFDPVWILADGKFRNWILWSHHYPELLKVHYFNKF